MSNALSGGEHRTFRSLWCRSAGAAVFSSGPGHRWDSRF
jgi:hypothetical protein